ncbi:MAG: flippase-like domain-containing protein [bacterium]|nr:flippase-like domain-containing protein [bacterium]
MNESAPSRRTWPLRIALSLAVAALLVALLLWGTGTSLAEIGEALAKLDPATYALALGVHASIYPLRAIRFRVLLAGDDPSRSAPSAARLVPVAAAHVLAANVLPAKVGEGALVLHLKTFCGVSGWRGLAVLMVSRLLDLAAMTLTLGCACLALGFVELGFLLIAGTSILVALTLRGDRILLRVERFLGTGTAIGRKFRGLSERLRKALVEVQASSLALSAPLSLAIWVAIFAFYAILARGLGLEFLSVFQAAFGTGLAIVAGLLPISGFAGFGAQDAGWVVGFGAVGVTRELATSTGLAAHVVFLFNIALFGLAGHLAMGAMKDSE